MSAIPCSSVSMRTMADGTLRLSIDIEPNNAQDAFRLFASPGTPAAIAALQVGYAAVTEPVSEKPKGGPLSKLAGVWCAHSEFQDWSSSRDAGDAAAYVRVLCNVDSRAELDHNPGAAEKFNQLIRGPFSKHLIARGITL